MLPEPPQALQIIGWATAAAGFLITAARDIHHERTTTAMSNREQAAQRAADSVQPFAQEIRNGGLGTNGPATIEAREAFSAAAAQGITHAEIRDAGKR